MLVVVAVLTGSLVAMTTEASVLVPQRQLRLAVVMLAIAIFPVRIGLFPQDAILELLRGAVRRGGAA